MRGMVSCLYLSIRFSWRRFTTKIKEREGRKTKSYLFSLYPLIKSKVFLFYNSTNRIIDNLFTYKLRDTIMLSSGFSKVSRVVGTCRHSHQIPEELELMHSHTKEKERNVHLNKRSDLISNFIWIINVFLFFFQLNTFKPEEQNKKQKPK